MTKRNYHEQPIDPRLKELLDALRETPPRNPEAEARGRAKYLAQLEAIYDQDTRPVAKAGTPSPRESRLKWPFSLGALQQRLAFTTVMAVLAIFLLLFGGAGATAYASQGALPGDALYPVKTSLEQTQVRLARDAARQAELHLSFSERRLAEIASLIAEGDFDHIETATGEFEAHVQEAIRVLDTVSAGDAQRACELATQITSALTRYAGILKGMLVSVPDTVKPSVEKAILISEREEHDEELEFTGIVESISNEGYVIGGQLVIVTPQTEIKGELSVGAMVKVHALQSPDGTLTAREIEVTQAGEENVNVNENENTNEVSNENDNTGAANLNDNTVENENEGMNLGNENEGEGIQNDNANMNINANDNTENDNTGSGSPSNMNNNDNSGRGNDNSGSGDNHNDNSGSGGNDNDSGGNGNENS